MSSGTEYILFPLLLVGRTIPTHTAKEEARFFKKMPASTLRDGFQFFVDKGRKENRKYDLTFQPVLLQRGITSLKFSFTDLVKSL